MKITLADFKGEVPRRSDSLLAERFAQTARNCNLLSGEIRAIMNGLKVNNPSKVGALQSIHRWGAVPGGDADGVITNVSNTTPIQIQSAGHSRSTNDLVFIDGTGIPSIDGKTHVVTLVGVDYFSLNTTVAAGVSSTGAWAKENGKWFHWLTDVDVIRGSVHGDTVEKTYYTGDGVPKMTYSPGAVTGGTDYPIVSYTLGVPAPVNALTATPGAGGGCAVSEQTTTFYVYTYVSVLGEEGPPSPPSLAADFCPGQTIDLSGMDSAPGGGYNLGATARKRIYRTAVGSSSYQFVGEVAIAIATYADTKANTELAESIPSLDYSLPPTDMHSLQQMPNGVAVGASKNGVFFSPAFLPHTFPSDWQLTTDTDVVGLGVFDGYVVVMTLDTPYLITGMDGPSMSMTDINLKQSCVSKRGIVGLDGFGVVYPSPDGLCAVGVGSPKVLTENYLTKEEWEKYNPSSIIGAAHEGRYYGFYDNGVTKGGFVFDPRDSGAGWTHIDDYAYGVFVDPLSDSIYIIDATNNIVKLNGGPVKQTFTYLSREFQTNYINLGIGRVYAESYADLTLKLYSDGQLKHTQSVLSDRPFRMPGGYYGEDVSVEVSGTDNVKRIVIAETMDDLK